MGLDPKGRAFYWRTPSRSNAPFLKHDEDLAPKRRTSRRGTTHFSKAAPVGYHAGPRNRPPSLQMTLEEIRALIQADLHSVDGVIRARLKSAVPLVDQVAEHIISGGGKRLRAPGHLPHRGCRVHRVHPYGHAVARRRGRRLLAAPGAPYREPGVRQPGERAGR